ncbi:MAG: hypothetical protein HOQ45_02385 [Nocardioidaceae bacterium]|nr:hypothetical protein [Nocardioidaceae bacterium]
MRDNFDAIGNWQAYTPTWGSGGTAPAIGNGSITGGYIQAGKTVMFETRLTFGSTTTFGTGTYTVTLPTPALNQGVTFTGLVLAGNTGYQMWGLVLAGASNTVSLRVVSSTNAQVLGLFNSTNPATLAAGDYFWLGGTYRAA